MEKKLTDQNPEKYSTTPDFNTLAASVFNARLTEANLITKKDFNAKLSSLNRKVIVNKTFTCWKWVEKLKTLDSNHFVGKSHFEEDGTQNYLVFQPMYRYFKRIVGVGNCNHICCW